MRTTWLKGRGFIWKHKGSDQPGRGPQPPGTSSPGPAACPGGSLDWTTTGQGQLQARHSLARARRSEGAAREAGPGLSQQCSALARLRGLTPHSRTHSIRRSLPRKPHRLLSL